MEIPTVPEYDELAPMSIIVRPSIYGKGVEGWSEREFKLCGRGRIEGYRSKHNAYVAFRFFVYDKDVGNSEEVGLLHKWLDETRRDGDYFRNITVRSYSRERTYINVFPLSYSVGTFVLNGDLRGCPVALAFCLQPMGNRYARS
ncbi:MAG: hypothetical protein ACXABY_01440 [Candidatus Thorarchaeota archaeon]